MTATTKLVALGSSFASGPGLPPYAEKAAMRSARNYAHLVAERLPAELTDLTVAGATTATVLDFPQRLGRHRFPPQLTRLPSDADLVTVTIGGNDLGYLASVVTAALSRQLERSAAGRPLGRILRASRTTTELSDARLRAAEGGLVRIVEEVRRRAPFARVLLVDYLPLFTDRSIPGPDVPFTVDEIAGFRRIAAGLSSVFVEAGSRSGAEVIPAGAFGEEHGLGAPDPWVFGLQPLRRLGSSFHPNARGMEAVARVIVGQVGHEDPRTV